MYCHLRVMDYPLAMRWSYFADAKTVLRKSLTTLSPKDRTKFFLATGTACLLTLIDVVGVASIAGIAALGSSAVQGKEYPLVMQSVLKFLGLEDLRVSQLAAILGLVSVLFMASKSILTLRLNRRILRFLANRENEFVVMFISRLFKLPYLKIAQKSSGEYINILTHSASSLITSTLGYFSIIVMESSVLVVMTVVLFLADPVTSIFTIFYFGVLTALSFFVTKSRSRELGLMTVQNNIEVFSAISDAINGFKEAKVTERVSSLVENIKKNRMQLPRIVVEQIQLTLIPKYLMEIGLIIGVICVAGLQFFRTDSSDSITILAVFFLASSRITPSLLRIQNTLLLLIQAKAAADPILETLQTIELFELQEKKRDDGKDEIREGFAINIEGVSFIYPNKKSPALSEISLTVAESSSLGIVGRSGSGKTTLVDIILGLTEPTHGKVRVGGASPHTFNSGHEGLFAYVPQSPYIKSASILENVAFGVPYEQIAHDRVWKALTDSNLYDFVNSLEDGIHHKLGERGFLISGGQRQRINIARALYFEPKILILDEATSALDIETELEINRVINNLKGVTRIIIAHRLTAVKNLDQIAVLEDGRLVELDSFDNLIKRESGIFKTLNDTFFNSSL